MYHSNCVSDVTEKRLYCDQTNFVEQCVSHRKLEKDCSIINDNPTTTQLQNQEIN